MFLFLFLCFTLSCAKVTVYYTGGQQQPIQTSSPTIPDLDQAYNPVTLIPPPLPTPAPPSAFTLPLQNGLDTGLSIPQSGCFLGFSIEFSVASQLIGTNASLIQPTFLNLMSNIIERIGCVNLRIGGTSIDTASLVDDLGSGQSEAVLYGTAIPAPLVYTKEFLYMLSNVSALLPVDWFLGIPFNVTSPPRLAIAEYAQAIIGSHLRGLQVGDQPDLYASEGYRPYDYSPNDYAAEFGQLINLMSNPQNITSQDPSLDPSQADYLLQASKILVGPNIISGDWTPEMVWDTGFADDYTNNLAALAVEHYPANNCYDTTGRGLNISSQEIFPYFLNHTSCLKLVEPYLNSANLAQLAGKPLLMLETNSASCGGFPGLSDSFAAALWALDYSLQMAYSNFSGAFFHIDGQNVSYNAFTPPPPLQGGYRQWTIGPVYYTALVMAETLGSSNISQVLDLNANNASIYTPAYAIYENGNASRVALFNYMNDPSGNSDYTVDITITQAGSDLTPEMVWVKYLSASSVSQKGNFTWAGQTFGGLYQSNGIPEGTETIQTIQCPNALCKITVPAPSFALVFLSPTALEQSSSSSSSSSLGSGPGSDNAELGEVATHTFATTFTTVAPFSGTVDPSILATSNGRSPQIQGYLGSTTRGKSLENDAIAFSRSGLGLGVALAVVLASFGAVLSGWWFV